MRIASLQFSGSSEIERNLFNIKNGIEEAASKGAKLLLTQECALSGYPPIETENILSINFSKIENSINQIRGLATKHNIYVAVGSVAKREGEIFNSIIMISPHEEDLLPYDKRALWGWDMENYKEGTQKGIYTIDDIKVGIRICFEVRFPEYFRELFKEQIQIALISFCDVSEVENHSRYEVIKSHLITRATENVMYVVTANSISKHQTAPTIIIDPDGEVKREAKINEPDLLIYDIEKIKLDFGRKGRIVNSEKLMGPNQKPNTDSR